MTALTAAVSSVWRGLRSVYGKTLRPLGQGSYARGGDPRGGTAGSIRGHTAVGDDSMFDSSSLLLPVLAALVQVPALLAGGDQTFSAGAERTPPPAPMGSNSLKAGFERLPEGYSCRFDFHLRFNFAALWVQRNLVVNYDAVHVTVF